MTSRAEAEAPAACTGRSSIQRESPCAWPSKVNGCRASPPYRAESRPFHYGVAIPLRFRRGHDCGTLVRVELLGCAPTFAEWRACVMSVSAEYATESRRMLKFD